MVKVISHRLFSVSIGDEFSSPGKLPCGVPQRSISDPLLFLLYVNVMPQALSCELLLYADDTCLIFMAIFLLRDFCPPEIWSENNRKICTTIEIYIIMDFAPPPKKFLEESQITTTYPLDGIQTSQAFC